MQKKKSEEIHVVEKGRRGEAVGERKGKNVIAVSLLQNWLYWLSSPPPPPSPQPSLPNTTDTHHRFGCYGDTAFLCVAPVHG